MNRSVPFPASQRAVRSERRRPAATTAPLSTDLRLDV
jgi:hypothetical protein